MAHRQTNLAGLEPIPTLEDAYELVMDKFTGIIRFIQRHMTVGHLLDDPWEEVCKLQSTLQNRVDMWYGTRIWRLNWVNPYFARNEWKMWNIDNLPGADESHQHRDQCHDWIPL